MNKKIEITKKVLEILNPNYTEKDYKTAINTWWFNARKKEKGGLRLTDVGYSKLIEGGIKEYFIRVKRQPMSRNNQFTIWLDQHINCPFYLEKIGIHVFEERTAFELVLYDGNIDHLVSSRAKH